MNAVAKNLKTIRTQKGYTQDDLAQALHVTRQTVSSWETGRSEPDIETLTTLAGFLQTDVTALIYGPEKLPYQTMQKKYKIWCLILSLFVLGVLCNIFIYIAVEGYLRNPHEAGKYLSLFFGVIVFILTGTEHCVADMFYFWMAGAWSGRAILCVIVISLGNAVGGVLIPLLRSYVQKEKSRV